MKRHTSDMKETAKWHETHRFLLVSVLILIFALTVLYLEAIEKIKFREQLSIIKSEKDKCEQELKRYERENNELIDEMTTIIKTVETDVREEMMSELKCFECSRENK